MWGEREKFLSAIEINFKGTDRAHSHS